MFTDFGIESQNVIHDLEPEKESSWYVVGKNIECINNKFRTSSFHSSK